MTAIRRKLPRDPNQRAKSIVDIVAALSEGEDPETLSDATAKDPERVARGKLGGAKRFSVWFDWSAAPGIFDIKPNKK
jgi:hypothetical protein